MMRVPSAAYHIAGWTFVALMVGYVGLHVGILLWFGIDH